jgi:hypothetical protein
VSRSIYPVDPRAIKTPPQHPREIRQQRERLEAEGQIEPIEVNADLTLDPDGWVYAGAQIAAAIELEWPTVLVTY